MEALRLPFAVGALAGCLFVAALLLLDIGGIGALIARDAAGLLPLFLLFLGFSGLFGIVVAATCFAMELRPRGHPIALKPVAVRASAAACRPRSPSR